MSLVQKTNCLNLTIKALAQKIFEILIFEVTYIYLSTHFFIFLTEINLKQRNQQHNYCACHYANVQIKNENIFCHSLPIIHYQLFHKKPLKIKLGKMKKTLKTLKIIIINQKLSKNIHILDKTLLKAF